MNLTERIESLSVLQALVGGLIFAAVYYFMVFDSGNSVMTRLKVVKEEVALNESKLEKLRVENQKSLALQEELIEVEKNLEPYVEVLGSGDPISKMVRLISDEARVAGLNIMSIQDSNSNIKEEPFTVYEISVNLKGTFDQVLYFLSYLTRVKKIILLTNFRFENLNQLGDKKSLVTFNGAFRAYSYSQKTLDIDKESEENPDGLGLEDEYLDEEGLDVE